MKLTCVIDRSSNYRMFYACYVVQLINMRLFLKIKFFFFKIGDFLKFLIFFFNFQNFDEIIMF